MLIDNIEIVEKVPAKKSNKKPLRYFEAFAGYGSQGSALKKYRGNCVCVGMSEIDKYAIQAHEAIHGPARNFGDISRINPLSLPDMDLFTYSFPCQDISMAGKQRGLKDGSGSRSSLLWECQKIIEIKRPKYLMMENVKNLVGKKHKPDYDRWLQVLEGLGYNNHWKVINAKHCGVPQNRERVFCVSILKEVDNFDFHFYDDFDSGIRLKDILESEVDEKYYMSEEKTKSLIESLEANGYNGYNGYKRNYECNGYSYCIDANYHKGTSIGNIGKARRTQVVERVGMLNEKEYPNDKNKRSVYNPEGLYPTLLRNPDKPKILTVGRIKSSQDGIILDPKGISKTHTSGHNNQPKIVEACAIRGRNPENPKSRESGLKTQQMLEVSKNPDINNCLTTVQKDTMLLENTIIDDTQGFDGVRFYPNYSPSLRSQRSGLKTVQKFRIRKLTPKECFRLMGVSDSDINKIQAAGISNTQQYKMAGNSIVVNCMEFLKQLK